ncbi:MAG: ATPase, T2SS/T4P/T4SS family, partial [Acidobacteria bacterium]|nr:ATPase, T2SS/T4P/T4SS family [Acidobacteriota bacterium]
MTTTRTSYLGELLKLAVKQGASDVHLRAGKQPYMRVDGELEKIDKPRLDATDVLDAVNSGLDHKDQARFDERRALDTIVSSDDGRRFRGTLFHDRHGPAATYRPVPPSRTLVELGLPSIIETWTDKRRGLILITGPTGSGTTATLAGIAEHVNQTRAAHILTLGHPIEHLHRGQKALFTQLAVAREDIPRALRAAGRQDPDLVVVDELPDANSVKDAMKLAESRLVAAGLRTTSVFTTLEQLLDDLPQERQIWMRYQLARVLIGISSQKLVARRRENGHPGTETTHGRVAAVETAIATGGLRNSILDGKLGTVHNILQTRAGGNRTMNQALTELAAAGTITIETALETSNLPHELKGRLKAKGKKKAQPAAPH